MKLYQGEKFLEENVPFSVCIHKAERGPEFSKLISSVWVKQLNFLILENLPPTTPPRPNPMSSCLAKCNLRVSLYWIFRGS